MSRFPLQFLDHRQPIVDPATGLPTEYFLRLLFNSTEFNADTKNEAESALAQVVTKADKTTEIIAGTGLTGGGDLSADRTLALTNTTVTPGSYTNTNLTVDAQGRITAASNGMSGVREVIYSNSQGIGSLASGGTAVQVLASVVLPSLADNDYVAVDAGFWRANAGSRARLTRLRISDGTNSLSMTRIASTNNIADMYRVKFLRITSTTANIFGELDQGNANVEVNGSGWLRRAGSRTAPANTTINWSNPVTLFFEAQVQTAGGVNDDIVLGHAFVEVVRA